MERWRIVDGKGPVVVTAIHAGHSVDDRVETRFAVDEATRLREEDPFTERWLVQGPDFSTVEVFLSRFLVDLNRQRDRAVYRVPEDAWGIRVWHEPPSSELVEESLRYYDDFYSAFGATLDSIVATHGAVIVLDLHSYNHRRDGNEAPPAPVSDNPDFNIGTGTLPDRDRWAWTIHLATEVLGADTICGFRPYVAENVRFRGGHLAKWVHDRYGSKACVLSIEVKKFFMDEWSGKGDDACIDAVGTRIEALRNELVRGFPDGRQGPRSG